MSTKKRLIFALLYKDGFYCQSRNFNIQKVGKFDWLFNNYNFTHIAEYLDELIVINVNPTKVNQPEFLEEVKRIINNVFIPTAIGGGIIDVKTADSAFNSGADKVIINSLIREDEKEVKNIVSKYGSQSVIVSIDYKKDDQKKIFDWKTKDTLNSFTLKNYIQKCENLNIGEILLNSVNKDGTGFGFDIETIKEVASYCKLPLIIMGGAGKADHFSPVYKLPNVDAVVTANLLNFIGEALPNVRNYLLNENINLAKFQQ